jgi:hypothetical protein
VAGAVRRSAIPIVLVLGSEEFAERCRSVAGGQALVVSRDPTDARHAATAWLPKAVVCTYAVYASDPAEVEATVRRVRARLVKVADENVALDELADQLRAALGGSGIRGKS